ncbi:MAG: class I SAM-dependent methyltransferase [Campylobacterales bacterium]|nr:class I SAM-dependent methyltransferase [Campylobacterales bacterium]
MNNFFDVSKMSAAQAQYEAQKIAFAPIVFQAVRVLRESGILKFLHENKSGMSIDTVAQNLSMTPYAVTVLLESGFSAGVVSKDEEIFSLTKIGYFLLNDPMTRINMDYNHYVNYLGLYELDKAVESGEPAGLKVFGEWETIYPGLTSLPEDAKKAWFDFDHFYSDSAFGAALKIIGQKSPKRFLDIGGNTGRFSRLCAQTLLECHVTIVDLPQQLAVASVENEEAGLSERIDTYAADMLKEDTRLPSGYDAAWMSQFLDCFGEEDIVKILSKIECSIDDKGKIYILEPMWDRQKYETSAYCLINTSPYFTAMANGKSKMFNLGELTRCILKAGLVISEIHDNVGFCHSLIVCEKKSKGE